MDQILDFLLYLVEFAIGLGVTLFVIFFAFLYGGIAFLLYKTYTAASTPTERFYDQSHDSQF